MQPSTTYPDAAGKRMASGALVFHDGRLLIVKPTYKDAWHVPGGLVDDGEGPREACEREIAEEIGLGLRVERLLAVDYRHNRGTNHGESVQFIFLAEDLRDEQLPQIRTPLDEIAEYRLLAPNAAVKLLEPFLALRVTAALDVLARGAETVYLESGKPVFSGTLP
jgi:ADP-ribose pyrophosphatase YjhB (NUDIX family)